MHSSRSVPHSSQRSAVGALADMIYRIEVEVLCIDKSLRAAQGDITVIAKNIDGHGSAPDVRIANAHVLTDNISRGRQSLYSTVECLGCANLGARALCTGGLVSTSLKLAQVISEAEENMRTAMRNAEARCCAMTARLDHVQGTLQRARLRVALNNAGRVGSCHLSWHL